MSAAACIGGLYVPATPPSNADLQPDRNVAVLDLGTACALRESLQGYGAVLGEENARAATEFAGTQTGSRTVIVPGAGLMGEDTLSALLDVLVAGGTVLLESGAGFMEPLEFAKHQKMLEVFFHINVGEPVDVWSEGRPAPYVHYDWPCQKLVRDFTRVIPVMAPEKEVFGRIGTLPLASKKQVGSGLLVFLGSPLGPALKVEDPDALTWVRSFARCR